MLNFNVTGVQLLLLVIAFYILHRFLRWVEKAHSIRSRYHNIPSFPRHTIWGNLLNAGQRLNPALKRHPDYGFDEIWRELGEPGYFLVDLAPIEDRGFLILAEPQYIETFANPSEGFKYSLPKSSVYQTLAPVIGAESMIAKDGADWKTLRRRFNPGFQPRHIHSLSKSVVAKTRIFVQRLQSLVESGDTFKLADYTQDLTMDIITKIVIDKDFGAQTTPTGIGEKSCLGFLTASRCLSELVYATGQGIGLHMIDPIRPLKAIFYQSIIDRRLTAIVKERLEKHTTVDKPKSTVQLAVSGLPPSKALIRSSVDQIKSFIFAGEDTTATLIQWMCYHMSKAGHCAYHAEILSRLRQEHDHIFGTRPFSALEHFSSGAATDSESIVNSRLPYTMAFVKETLRLHPPAATVRVVPDDALSASLQLRSRSVSVTGLQIYPCLHIIHRNPNVWGPDAHIFRPDRFLDEVYLAKLPVGAWRPFERGPRNCIGQELAMLEGVVVLSAIARGFVFEKVGLTGRAVYGGKEEKEVWSDHKVTSVPVDGMVMRVSMA